MIIWAAKAAFEEKQKEPGERKFADFIILDTDLMTCPAEAILKTNVLATYSNGEKVFSKIMHGQAFVRPCTRHCWSPDPAVVGRPTNDSMTAIYARSRFDRVHYQPHPSSH